MNNIEKIKKYKELLDARVITQEEFDIKKKELLENNISKKNTKIVNSSKKKINLNKKIIKKVVIVISICLFLIVAILGINAIIEHHQHSQRASALETEILPLMKKYGISTYKVKYGSYDYEIYAENFELLANSEKLNLLIELGKVSIKDPCGDGTLEIDDMVNVHPGLDVEYSYWRVPSYVIYINEMYGGGYKVPGLYSNFNGNHLVLESEN